MSVRRQTANRLTLFRTCGTCGKQIVTTADTPWVRQVERDGKRQATTYFCSEGCFAAEYWLLHYLCIRSGSLQVQMPLR